MDKEQKSVLDKMDGWEIAQYLRNERNTAFILWQVLDITGRAENLGIEISEEEAKGILYNLNDKSDCEQGITWYHIDNEIQDLEVESKQ